MMLTSEYINSINPAMKYNTEVLLCSADPRVEVISIIILFTNVNNTLTADIVQSVTVSWLC